MQEYEAGIIRTESKGGANCLFTLECGDIAEKASPGQFVQVRMGDSTDPFLRRSYSICRTDPDKGTLNLLISAVGKMSTLLCKAGKSTKINLIGPLGQGFDINLAHGTMSLLVAGGYGAAPLVFLAEELRKSGKEHVFMIGGKRTADVKVIDGLLDAKTGCEVATEDCSPGYQGRVTGLLQKYLESNNGIGAIYTCGPTQMMKTVAEIATLNGIRCQVSVEEKMACGMGVCLGCAVRVRDRGMVRSCKEGPVFNAEDILW